MSAYVRVILACGNVWVRITDTENDEHWRISVFEMMA